MLHDIAKNIRYDAQENLLGSLSLILFLYLLMKFFKFRNHHDEKGTKLCPSLESKLLFETMPIRDHKNEKD